jgi:predicted nucleic acid-binding protein
MRWDRLRRPRRQTPDEGQIQRQLNELRGWLAHFLAAQPGELSLERLEEQLRWALLRDLFRRGAISTGLLAAFDRVSRRRVMDRLQAEGVPLAAPSARELADEARAVRRWLDGPAVLPVATVPTLVLLSRLRRLSLLRELFGRVVVLRDDHLEVLAWGTPLPDAATFQTASWIEVRAEAETGPLRRRRRWCTDTEYRALRAACGDDGPPGLLLAEEAAMKRAAAEAGAGAAGLAALLLAAEEAALLPDAGELLAALPAQGYRLPHPVTR